MSYLFSRLIFLTPFLRRILHWIKNSALASWVSAFLNFKHFFCAAKWTHGMTHSDSNKETLKINLKIHGLGRHKCIYVKPGLTLSPFILKQKFPHKVTYPFKIHVDILLKYFVLFQDFPFLSLKPKLSKTHLEQDLLYPKSVCEKKNRSQSKTWIMLVSVCLNI